MTARLLCPTCGAPVRECTRGELRLTGWSYVCTGAACGKPTIYPYNAGDVDVDVDAARRARIKGAMPEGGE